MFINIGSNKSVRKKEIVGIFDLDTASHEKETRDFLKISDEELYFVGGEENITSFMENYGISVVVETLGSKGAKYFLSSISNTTPTYGLCSYLLYAICESYLLKKFI